VFETGAHDCKLDPRALVYPVLDDSPDASEDHGRVDDDILEELFGTAVAAEGGDLLDIVFDEVGLLRLREFVQIKYHLHLPHFLAELRLQGGEYEFLCTCILEALEFENILLVVEAYHLLGLRNTEHVDPDGQAVACVAVVA